MQSIITRYRGPTATGPAKIIVKATSGIRRAYSLDYERTDDQQHSDSAKRFAEELGWTGIYYGSAYNNKGAMIWIKPNPADHFTTACKCPRNVGPRHRPNCPASPFPAHDAAHARA